MQIGESQTGDLQSAKFESAPLNCLSLPRLRASITLWPLESGGTAPNWVTSRSEDVPIEKGLDDPPTRTFPLRVQFTGEPQRVADTIGRRASSRAPLLGRLTSV
jgi:hypothetical protein